MSSGAVAPMPKNRIRASPSAHLATASILRGRPGMIWCQLAVFVLLWCGVCRCVFLGYRLDLAFFRLLYSLDKSQCS